MNLKMNEIPYFIGDRDPQKGGLCIIETSEGFSPYIQSSIENNCLELISSDFESPCTAYFPISRDSYVLIMATKMEGTMLDNRLHDLISGIVVNKQELNVVLDRGIICCIEQVINRRESESILILKEEVLDRLSAEEVLGFYNATKAVATKYMKVQLLVDKGKEESYQRSLVKILPETYRSQLFCIANGECTLADADILITANIVYQDARKYYSMTVSEFIRFGNEWSEKRCSNIKKEKYISAVEMCEKYILTDTIPRHAICGLRKEYGGKSLSEWREMQNELRKKLEIIEPEHSQMPRYMIVLWFAFENYKGGCSNRERPLLMCPYDIDDIVLFLKSKVNSRWTYRRYIHELFEVYAKEYSYLKIK